MEGWRCPGCGRCYSPYISACSFCPTQFTVGIGTNSEPDRCPACHQHRSMPPLTGCPMGSHYGSYCVLNTTPIIGNLSSLSVTVSRMGLGN
jgi:hypothetical protein